MSAARWVDSRGAADLRGVGPNEPAYLSRAGHIHGRKQAGRWRFDVHSIERYLAVERRYVSMEAAAKLTGLSRSTVKTAAAKGLIKQRRVTHSRPSVDRDSGLAWCERHRAAVVTAEKERRAAEEQRRAGGPPQDGDVWLGVTTVSLLLQVSDSWVRHMARVEALPAVRTVSGRWWFRRGDMERIAAARAFRQRMQLLREL